MKEKKQKNTFISIVAGLVLCLVSVLPVGARQPEGKNGADIQLALEKLLTLGRFLYIAAHPDDENTAVLAYMASERKMRTGYLSLTRGAGGQNLIGTEKGPLMGVIRTMELLEARRIDGAEQFFTRALDFGYSKTAKETMAIWGKDHILADMVFTIRQFRPDVVATRFPIGPYGGHGHHGASAQLAVEAFHAAADPTRFPEQLKHVSVWRAKRLVWNDWRPTWRPKDLKPGDLEKLTPVNIGTYNPQLGKSYYEVSALSRSMHKSQGFGSVPQRGRRLDYFSLMEGEPMKKDLFDGVDTTWNRVPGSKDLRQLLERALQNYRPDQPHQVLPLLMDALTRLRALPASHWTRQKEKELKNVIRWCAGLWIEAISPVHTITPGKQLKITATVLNRSPFPFRLKEIRVHNGDGQPQTVTADHLLEENIPHGQELTLDTTGAGYTNPYWLQNDPRGGLYEDAVPRLRGKAVGPAAFRLTAVLETRGGKRVELESPVMHRLRDPVEGEVMRDMVVMPPVTVNFSDSVYYFNRQEPRPVDLILFSGPDPVSGQLKLKLPPGWKSNPAVLSFDIPGGLTQKRLSVSVTPPPGGTTGDITAEVTVSGGSYDRGRMVVDYPHLPLITLHPRAKTRFVRVEAAGGNKKIGYVMGSGDDIPRYLGQLGYPVDLLGDDDLHTRDLSLYDTLVLGVRAYNTRDILKHVRDRLLAYVHGGGRLVVQYTVSRGVKVEQVGPYPLRLSRARVTEENAAVTMLEADHPLLNTPYQIRPVDFNGWVQERGLYFADQWAPAYTPVLACADSGEEPQKGGLLVARYGKGQFIYTGYAFFRQLPAGVAGALKLFVNIIDGPKGDPTQSTQSTQKESK